MRFPSVFPAAVTLLVAATASAGSPSFRNEVMAVLSRAGCNQGTCHGNLNGKGGFGLSLRGEDWQQDYDTITRGDGGRRVDRLDGANSLVLLKPTMVIPHEGGRRFRPGDRAYQILSDWIAAGAPLDAETAPVPVSLTVLPDRIVLDAAQGTSRITATAAFSDGTRRDVTDLVVFEPSNLKAEIAADGTVSMASAGETTIAVRYGPLQQAVRVMSVPDRPNYSWSAPPPVNYIDEIAFAKFRQLKVNPAPVCDDATFVRRAYLDLTGLLPTADEARRFVADTAPDKRERLVDQLLSDPAFAMFWGLKWADLLRAEEKSLDDKGVQVYVDWIRESITENKPLDEFARELVTGRGSTYEVAPANFYRGMRDPITRAESVAQLFLGVRLQCAKCHNHPFDRWTQEDYYGWANNFSQIGYEIKENNRKDKNDKHEFVGEQIVVIDVKQEPVKHPETNQPVPPRFLDASGDVPPSEGDRLESLAAWLTDPKNKAFADTMANRVWAELLGRGLVDPTDDFRLTNPPAIPELLDALSADLVEHDFDLRHMVRTIMASQVYQLASTTDATNADDGNFSHAYPRRLSAEQLLDALAQVTGTPLSFDNGPKGLRAAELIGVRAIHGRRSGKNEAESFLKLFGKPPRLTPCDCERTDDTTLAQSFQLLSGELLADLLQDPRNRLTALAASDQPSRQIVDDLYWTALTRDPTEEERQSAIAYLDAATDRRQALEDLTWALVTSTDFLLRH